MRRRPIATDAAHQQRDDDEQPALHLPGKGHRQAHRQQGPDRLCVRPIKLEDAAKAPEPTGAMQIPGQANDFDGQRDRRRQSQAESAQRRNRTGAEGQQDRQRHQQHQAQRRGDHARLGATQAIGVTAQHEKRRQRRAAAAHPEQEVAGVVVERRIDADRLQQQAGIEADQHHRDAQAQHQPPRLACARRDLIEAPGTEQLRHGGRHRTQHADRQQQAKTVDGAANRDATERRRTDTSGDHAVGHAHAHRRQLADDQR